MFGVVGCGLGEVRGGEVGFTTVLVGLAGQASIVTWCSSSLELVCISRRPTISGFLENKITEGGKDSYCPVQCRRTHSTATAISNAMSLLRMQLL